MPPGRRLRVRRTAGIQDAIRRIVEGKKRMEIGIKDVSGIKKIIYTHSCILHARHTKTI
jgi:metal-responsive CopG/Arc/MetJ family transcriptional regulator